MNLSYDIGQHGTNMSGDEGKVSAAHEDGDGDGDDDDDDDDSNLNESMERIATRYDGDNSNGPTAMTPIRGVDVGQG